MHFQERKVDKKYFSKGMFRATNSFYSFKIWNTFKVHFVFFLGFLQKCYIDLKTFFLFFNFSKILSNLVFLTSQVFHISDGFYVFEILF